MSSDAMIRVADLGKCYHIYERPHHRLRQALWRGRQALHREFWALRDVSFEVGKGETFGIIGCNGSGKSTLLQIISNTLMPTVGEVSVRGRVAALLELGAGFNPDFTGRENAYLNAAIMGLTRHEMDARYDSIVAFAELTDFMDRPVKTYSSGMYVRLAFAVAIHMQPDILVVDEALAVGDVRFQTKCFREFQRMQERGVTILLVTHATEMVVKHCNRALFLDAGRICSIGSPRDVVHAYLTFLFGDMNAVGGLPEVQAAATEPTGAARTGPARLAEFLLDASREDRCARHHNYNPAEYRWGDQRARIVDYLVRAGEQDDPAHCTQGQAIDIYMKVTYQERLDDLIYGLTIKTVDGVTVSGSNTRISHTAITAHEGGDIAVVRFRLMANLVAGDYFVSLGVAIDDPGRDNIAIDRRYDMIHLHIEDSGNAYGIAFLDMEIEELALGTPERAVADA